MKKHVLILIILFFSLAACSLPAGSGQSPLPLPSVSPAETPMPSPTPPPTVSASPSPSPSDSAYKQPTEYTVIIANSKGYIIGGYSDGKWLTHVEAAAYCSQPMEFYRPSNSETVQSSGVHMESGGHRLNIADDYSHGFLFRIKPERFAKTGRVNRDKVSRAVQKRLDSHYGKGKATAKIIMDFSADIDNDGKKEIIFNSNTLDEDLAYSGEEGNWYSIVGVIEEDRLMHLIAEYYNTDYGNDGICAWIENAVDINGDGVCEFVVKHWGCETETVNVYKYDGKDFTQVLEYKKGF